jgi:hypothetical protein
MNMKLVKIKKSDLKGDFEDFLRTVSKRAGKVLMPDQVYISKVDYLVLRKNVKALVNKKFRSYTSTYKQNVLAIADLQHGPNQSLQDGIASGFVLVVL